MKKFRVKNVFALLIVLLATSCQKEKEEHALKLWYNIPANVWTDALPIGNGRLGAMVFGGVENDRIQFNEETLWKGEPTDYAHKGAYQYLDQIRQLLFDGKQKEAENLAMKEFMSVPLTQRAYQAFGDLKLHFPGQQEFTAYRRELDLKEAVSRVSYLSNGVKYTREYFASNPDQVVVVHLTANKKEALRF